MLTKDRVFRKVGMYSITWEKGDRHETTLRYVDSEERLQSIIGTWKGNGYTICHVWLSSARTH